MRSSLLVASLVLGVASPALAQPGPVLMQLRAPTIVAPDPPATEVAPAPRDHGPRPRYGFSIGFLGGGGTALGSDENVAPGLGGEIQGRIGVQLEDHVAIFYQGSFAGGREVPVCITIYGPPRPCPPSDDALYLHASSIVLDFTFMRGMQVGVGGSVVAAFFDTAHPTSEIRYGWLARVGYAFGGEGPGNRNGFTLGFQANLSVALQAGAGPLVDLALSLGWESF